MKLFILLISIFLFSCTDAEKYSQQLIKLDDWTVPLDTLTSNLSFGVRNVKINGKSYLGMYSRNLHAINLWNINSKKKEFTIQLKKDGEDGIYRLISFYIKGMDSVFVIPAHYKEMLLVDFSGHVKNKYVIEKKTGNTNDENIIDNIDFLSDNYSPILFVGNQVLIGTMSYKLSSLDPKFSQFPIGLTYDIKTNQINDKFMFYPENYVKNTYSMFHDFYYTDLDLNLKNLIVSFPVDEKIYLRDINGKLIKEVEAKSDYLNINFNSFKVVGQAASEKYFLDNPSYNRILSDPYRKVYYRFALQKYEGKGNVPTLMMSSYMPLSVIILNEQFEKIGETLLPADKHFILNAFVGKKGLYISNAHPNNPENDENKLSFTCYQLVKK